jgi:hypothetical protein
MALRLRGVSGSARLSLGEVLIAADESRSSPNALHLTGEAGQTRLSLGALNVSPEVEAHAALILAHTAPCRARITLVKNPAPSVRITGRTRAPRAAVRLASDPNLLSAVHYRTAVKWSAGPGLQALARPPLRRGIGLRAGQTSSISPAPGLRALRRNAWQTAPRQQRLSASTWQAGAPRYAVHAARWRAAARLHLYAASHWTDGQALRRFDPSGWLAAPRLTLSRASAWTDGARRDILLIVPLNDGPPLQRLLRISWRDAGYPGNARRFGPTVPTWPPSDTPLSLCGPIGDPRLSLGAVRCGVRHRIRIQRSYTVHNAVSLVRLPDRTPLPVTDLTLETDADSYCWGLSATLKTPAALTLVQPQAPAYRPIEVEASINGWIFNALLDRPRPSRQFNAASVSVQGLSRSAWLAEPWHVRSSGVESTARTARQLADAALENTGWTLIWDLPDWLIPGGLLAWEGTPIDRLKQLVKPVDGCLYSDPAMEVITAYSRYPTPAWQWASADADLALPESLLRSESREVYATTYCNGVYVSGTTHGVHAQIKRSGTAGELLAASVADPLISDADAIAARARGVSILSAASAGEQISAESLLYPSGSDQQPGLIRPGQLIDLGEQRGRVRGVRLHAQWSDALTVHQTITIEQRDSA